MREKQHNDRVLAELGTIDHPLRFEILTSLSLRPASANELAAQLDAPVGKVRYQLDRLRKAGLAELKETRQRRGVSEQVYFVRAKPLTDDEFSRLSEMQRERMVAGIVKGVLGDVLKGMQGKAFSSRDDFVIARTPIPLDEKGWRDAAKIHREALTKLIEVREESRARFDTEGGPTSEAFSFLLFFEMPRPDPA